MGANALGLAFVYTGGASPIPARDPANVVTLGSIIGQQIEILGQSDHGVTVRPEPALIS